MINTKQISKKLLEIPIEEIAATHNFSIHKDAKITATSFVLGFFLMIKLNSNTLKDWAIEVSSLLGQVFTDNAIQSKLQYPQLDFAKNLLNEVINRQMNGVGIKKWSVPLLSAFNKVYIEDSMCMKLPKNLATTFPGAHSKTGQAATAKIQCRVELKSGNTTRLEVQSFRDNDQKFSSDIVKMLKAGDLVIRDLGYSILRVFNVINFMRAFFLSRFKYRTTIYDSETRQQIDLLNQLKKANQLGINSFELSVLVGKEEQLPVRLVAIKVPENIAQQRRHKASKDRNKRVKRDAAYMLFLGWTIFITNVDKTVWTPQQMLKVYGFRWRIEIIFKCWKSNFHFEALFQKKQSLTPARTFITLYLLLVWITLFFVRLFQLFLNQVYDKHQKFVSILKFAKFFKDRFIHFFEHPDWNFLVDLVAQHCTYSPYKKIPNFYENLFSLTTMQDLQINENQILII